MRALAPGSRVRISTGGSDIDGKVVAVLVEELTLAQGDARRVLSRADVRRVW